MSFSLPRPNVTVSQPVDGVSGKERLDVTISRDDKSRSYSSEAGSVNERVKDVFEKVLNDGHTAEWLP